jgi:hypothetical protein
MRLNLAVTILAGLLLGLAAAAQADPPPAAPIFYCPTPGKAAPAGPATPATRAELHHHHHGGCPTLRVAAEHHHGHGRAPAPAAVASNNDVSASQAFIYRYERAVHGLQPQAASRAWAEGNHPAPPAGNPPPPSGPALAQREIPPPPCPHNCPGAWRHAGPPPMAQQGPPPMALRPAPPVAPLRPAPPPPQPDRAYAWSDGQSGYGYSESVRQSERAGGWSYGEENGQGHYSQWGDQFGGQPRRWAGPPRCPPPVPASACTAGLAPSPDYRVAGRDAAGYLTWPGKTPAW